MTILNPADLTALLVSFKLALISSASLLVICTPLAWWLAHARSRALVVVEATVMMPLVLPPTVLGFYLLLILGPHGWIGASLESLGFNHLAFSFPGLVIGSMIYSLPFVVQPLTASFQSAGRRLLEVAATLRASSLDSFFHVVVPLSGRGFLTATVLSFAHTLGEFGVIIMVGGNIPGVTQVASIAIYDHVEAMDYNAAHRLAGVLVAVSFSLLLVVYSVNRRFRATGVPS